MFPLQILLPSFISLKIKREKEKVNAKTKLNIKPIDDFNVENWISFRKFYDVRRPYFSKSELLIYGIVNYEKLGLFTEKLEKIDDNKFSYIILKSGVEKHKELIIKDQINRTFFLVKDLTGEFYLYWYSQSMLDLFVKIYNQ